MMKLNKLLFMVIILFSLFSCNNNSENERDINGLYIISQKEYDIDKIEEISDNTLLLTLLATLDSTNINSIFPNYLYINDSTLTFLGNRDKDKTVEYTLSKKNDSTINLLIKNSDTIIFHNGTQKSLVLQSFRLSLNKIAY